MPNSHRSTLIVALAATGLAGCASHTAAAPPAPARQPVSRVWFTGASNIRHFTCRARTVHATLALAPGATVDSALRGERAAAAAVVAASVEVPVEGLDCGIGHMNADLHRVLEAPAAPTIAFRVAGYTPPAGDAAAALLDGTLEIAGVQRPLRAAAALERPAPGVVRLRGRQTIRPTDFGVAPPRRFFGLLRVRNEVTVHFDVTVAGEALGRRTAGL